MVAESIGRRHNNARAHKLPVSRSILIISVTSGTVNISVEVIPKHVDLVAHTHTHLAPL